MYKLFEFSSKNINFEDMENYILEISLWYVYLNMKQRDMKFFLKCQNMIASNLYLLQNYFID